MERNAKVHAKRSNKGTSARTRPFSFDEIMLKRRKKLAADPKGGIEVSSLSEKNDDEGHGQSDADERNKSIKVSNDAEKGSSKRIEAKDKGKHDLEANTKVKSTHSKSSREKDHRTVKPGHHKSNASDRLGADSEREHEKKGPKGAVENKKHEERDTKSKNEKRKHSSHIDEKGRLDYDNYYSKKHDLGRSDRKKEYSQPYTDERRSKRRRSRSPQYDRERDRSLSVSPRIHKRSNHGRDYGDSSYQSYGEKSRRNYTDTEKYRADTGGFASEHQWKNGSGLGGYSPRKRKTEAAVKTPSPTIRSPERKSGTWDQPPDGTSNAGSASMLANLQSPATTMVPEVVSSVPVTPVTAISQPVLSIDNAKILLNPSTDSVQLTQATRPMRRIYIENLPPSASDKTVVDCFNDFLMLHGVNYIQRIKPCISCIINKEKSQALVEFLTPEDATKALSFDGRSLSGSILKIRRPKDFVEAATGAPEKLLKPVAVTKTISDVVTDTPHKIFVGGISRTLSSDMLVEIVSAFGHLRAYHFEFHEELDTSTAFLEYADHSVTLKACAGLNGIKLGGHVLTAVQAIPGDRQEKEASGTAVSYIIPDHAKPLLADPTPVLQLKNLFDRDELLLLSEAELDEVLEDVRLECARFGTVKSVNIVRYDNSSETATVDVEQDLSGESCKMEAGAERDNIDSHQNRDLTTMDNSIKELQNVIEDEAVNNSSDKEPTNLVPVGDTNVSEEPLKLADASGSSPARFKVESSAKSETYGGESGLALEEVDAKLAMDDDSDLGVVGGAETKRDSERTQDGNTDLNATAADDAAMCSGGADGQSSNLFVFEAGCVLVEYSRAEAACMAAHSLHGRLFGEKIVVVGYVPHDLYLARFQR